jgi:hypothetical protein
MAARLFGASPERALALLRAAWPAAVGSELARRTEVLSLDSGLLRVRVPDAGWRRQLVRVRGEILSRLRGIAGGVAPRALGFVEGSVAAPPEGSMAATPEGPNALPAPAPPGLVVAAESIPDPEVRAGFLATAGRYLHRFAAAPRQAGDEDAPGSG